MTDDSTKVCKACGVEKPLGEFGKRACVKGGYNLRCKECIRARGKAHYEKNKEKLNAKVRQKRKDRPEMFQKYNKTKASKVGEDGLTPGARYYRANKERQKAAFKKWVEENRERFNRLNKAWRSANPEAVSAYNSRTRSVRDKVEGTFNKSDVAKQLKLQNYLCFWCGTQLKSKGKDRFHCDHYIPISRGGTNWPDNIVCACQSCNLTKHDKMPKEFLEYMEAKKSEGGHI